MGLLKVTSFDPPQSYLATLSTRNLSVPYEIKAIAHEDDFKRGFGSILKAYPKTTFNKDPGFRTLDAEFVSLGHPFFEAVLEWVERELSR